ncbi:hypothetical protein [Persicitalea sp.]|uniref:hypothetical protein n=1 Tax=Persicitalea sp. TaxID=3100273 RepID=UPI0035947D40
MKKIHSIRLSFLLLATLPMLAVTCGKKNNDPAPKASHPATVASVWAWQKLLVSPPVDNITDILDFYVQLSILTSKCLPLFLYEFKSNGSLVAIEQKICQATGVGPVEFGPKTGDTWAVTGNKIVLTHLDGTKDEADLEIKDSKLADGSKSKLMIWKRKIGDRMYTWEFERKL